MKGKEMKGEMCEGGSCCAGGGCHRCVGFKWVLVGVLVLLNVRYPVLSWPVFIGVLAVLKGLMKVVMPHCPHCR